MQAMSSVEAYRHALQQQLLYYQQLQQIIAVEEEIENLKARIAGKHKKHRRCDREISKDFKCQFCQKHYASDIALKLHYKLKHRKVTEDRTGGCSTEEEHALPQQLSSDLIQVNQPVA